MTGRVVTTESDDAISGVSVGVVGTELVVNTGRDGSFEIRMPVSESGIWFSRLGYAPDTVQVLGDGDVGPLLVRLTPLPIALRGVAAEGERRQSGAAVLTRETVRQVPPLAEPDLLRVIALLPEASQPNDLKGRVHLAGGNSDETGLRVDGHPLQDPFHLLGLLSAFPLAALERADVLVHHLPASEGGSLSGVIAMEMSKPNVSPAYDAFVGVGSATVGLSQGGPWATDVLATGRITYLDRLADLADLDTDFPRYGFMDGLVRVGRTVGPWRAEVLGFATRDRFRDPALETLGDHEPLTWGEQLVGVRLTRRSERSWLALRGSFNRSAITLDERPLGRTRMIDIDHEWWSGEASFGFTGSSLLAQAGAAIDYRLGRQSWDASGLVDEVLTPSTPGVFEGSDTLSTLAAWVEGGVRLAETWRVSLGARATRAAGEWYAAPRAVLSGEVAGATLYLAANRRFQFDALVEEPVEGSAAPPIFTLEQPRRADVLAIAVERPANIGSVVDATLRAQAYVKRYVDRVLVEAPDPTLPQPVEFPVLRRIEGDAMGAAISARIALSGSQLLEASYALQRVREEVDGTTSPTSWDVPHSLTVFGSWSLGRSWTLNTAFQAHSGRATTPVIGRIFAPFPGERPDRNVPSRYLVGERNSVRVPPYRRLDLGVRKRWEGTIQWTLSVQILNVLSRANPIDYDWQQYYARFDSEFTGVGRNGLPILPSIGLEARW